MTTKTWGKIAIGMLALFIISMCALVGSSHGADLSYYKLFGTSSRLDSVDCLLYKNGALNTTVTVTGSDTTFTITDDANWMLLFSYYWDGGSDPFSDPVEIVQPLVPGVGSELDTLDIMAYDTVALASVSGVKITVTDSATGSTSWQGYTDATGVMRAKVTSGTVYLISGSGPPSNYVWNDTTLTMTSGLKTDSMSGYGIPLPTASTGNVVTAYIDVGSGMIDSTTGLMIPRDKLWLYLSLDGEPGMNDGTWLIVTKVWKKKPDAAGRVTFTVPATTTLVDADGAASGAKYVLTYRATDGSSFGGQVKSFYLDTIPDPINILNASEAW